MGTKNIGVSLYPDDTEALRREVMAAYGLTMSGALRFVLRDWRIMKGADLEYDKKLAGRIARSLGRGSARRCIESASQE